jgi:hypothetical protein
VGGSGKGLVRNYHYAIKTNLNFPADRSNDRNVRFVNFSGGMTRLG